MTEPKLVPTAIDSERAVLSTVLYDHKEFAKVRAIVSDDEFYREAHREIWSVICGLADFGALDMTAVHEQLALTAPKLLPALVQLATVPPVASVEWHSERIVAAAASRGLLQVSQRLAQQVETTEDPIGLAEHTIDELRLIQRATASELTTLSDFNDVVQRVVDPANFVVPGLLAKGNRIIITSPEGYGKSSLLRQIGACASAGVHPFKTRGFCRPVRALVVDAENPEEVNTIEYQRVADALTELGRTPERGMLSIDECGPVNLLDGRTAAQLYALVERIQPELLIIGPIYQLHEDNPNDEGPARKLAAVLDRLRRISGAALVTEAHTPHNDGPQGQLLRPFGASLWKRWPEFGYCLHPVVVPRRNSELSAEEQMSVQMRESHFTPWRGNRAVRDWPTRLCAGGLLPWGTY